jgi:hypothetical protein
MSKVYTEFRVVDYLDNPAPNKWLVRTPGMARHVS